MNRLALVCRQSLMASLTWLLGVCTVCRNFSSPPPSPSEKETQQSDLRRTFALRTRCGVTCVDTARRLARRSCQRCSCSRSRKKLTIGSNNKTKQNRAKSHVQEGENRQKPRHKDFCCFPVQTPHACTVSSLAPRRLLVLGSPAGGVSRQPVGRPALAPPVAGATPLSARLLGGQTRRGGSGPLRVQHPAGGSDCAAVPGKTFMLV